MQKKMIWVIKWFGAATFFVPLVVVSSSYIFPFIVPKILLMRSLMVVMLATYSLLLVIDFARYRPKFTPLNIAVALFLFAFGISTFVGVDVYHSFWDNHERMLGLFTMMHFGVYYFILTSVFDHEDYWVFFRRFFLVAGFMCMFVGFWQRYVNPQALLNNGSDRVSATLGNAIYFSGYGLFLMFLSAINWFREKTQFWKWFSVVTGLFGFFGIFWGGTRGTLIGLLFSIGVMVIILLLLLRGHKKARLVLAGLMVAGIGLLSLAYAYRSTTFVSNIPALGRLVNTQLTNMPRLRAWGTAYDAFLEKPIFGWGPNNFYFAFNKYYRPQMLMSGWGETWFDNAHNVIMNTLAVQGAFGLIIYLGLFGVAITSLWSAYRAGRVPLVATILFTGFLTAHLVHNIFVFENPTSYLYFFFFLAMTNSYAFTPSVKGDKKKDVRIISYPGIIIVACVAGIFIYSTDIIPSKANKATLEAIQLAYALSPQAVDKFKEAEDYGSPHIDDIRNDFARTMTEQIPKYWQKGLREDVQKIWNNSYENMKKNRELHPADVRVNIQQSNLEGMGAQIFGDANLIKKADETITEALVFSPKRQQLLYMSAEMKLKLNQPDEALRILKKTIDDEPKIMEGWVRYADVLRAIGRVDEAKAAVREAQTISTPVFFDEYQKSFMQMILDTTSTPVGKTVKKK